MTPVNFVFVDFNGDFGGISMYHANEEIQKVMRDMSEAYIFDPFLKKIELTISERVGLQPSSS